MTWQSHRGERFSGEVKAPGDKSCSHRALIMAAMAEGHSHIFGLLEADDVMATAKAMALLGADVAKLDAGEWQVEGVGQGGFQTPQKPLDFGNSGTGVRLAMGAVAGYDIQASFIGDASLSSRPMGRIAEPLELMGAKVDMDNDSLPVTLKGGQLKAISYKTPKPSAQIKSAILLAGLHADGETIINESRHTRDHTEKMFKLFDVKTVTTNLLDDGSARIALKPSCLKATDITIPGDPSSAAFLVAAALIAGTAEVKVRAVLHSEPRFGFYEAIRQMDADISVSPAGKACGETLVDVVARKSSLIGIELDPALVPSMIDEIPVFAVLAGFAEGQTRIKGAQELRVKESDRLSATAALLKANGVEVEELEDGLIINGKGEAGVEGGGHVLTHHDHRIAMSALIMGLASRQAVSIDDAAMIATSYPDFKRHIEHLGGQITA